LRNFGLKVGMVGTVRFEARIQELVETIPDLEVLVEPLLVVRRTLREQIVILHRRLLAIVRDDEVCRRLMTTPGVGPVVALSGNRRCASPIPKIQVRRGSVWADVRQTPRATVSPTDLRFLSAKCAFWSTDASECNWGLI
jgi:hypothetical protein